MCCVQTFDVVDQNSPHLVGVQEMGEVRMGYPEALAHWDIEKRSEAHNVSMLLGRY